MSRLRRTCLEFFGRCRVASHTHQGTLLSPNDCYAHFDHGRVIVGRFLFDVDFRFRSHWLAGTACTAKGDYYEGDPSHVASNACLTTLYARSLV